jgi:hypothetical protein
MGYALLVITLVLMVDYFMSYRKKHLKNSNKESVS